MSNNHVVELLKAELENKSAQIERLNAVLADRLEENRKLRIKTLKWLKQ